MLLADLGDREFALFQGENVIGRTRGAAVRIDSTTVSRRHARTVISGESATLEDLGSKNGTQLGGRRVEGAMTLNDGDVVRVGSVALTFRMVLPECSTATGG